jgi:hypothetical protein
MHPLLARVPDGYETIYGEPVCPIDRLPQPWPDIAAGREGCAHPEKDKLVDFMRLFYTKMTIDSMRHDLARQSVAFYGHDWNGESYPSFGVLHQDIAMAADPQAPEIRLKRHVLALFQRYGYLMPGSFYRAHLLPLQRSNLFEVRYLRFSKSDERHVRETDAILHAQNVFGIHDEIQAMASEEGFRWNHGCDCKHSLGQLVPTASRYDYRIPDEEFPEAVRTYIWRMLHEYALFPLTVTTRYVF